MGKDPASGGPGDPEGREEMLVMFAVGVMNVFWMGAIALAIIGERYLPGPGDSVRKLTGIALLGFGLAHWLSGTIVFG